MPVLILQENTMLFSKIRHQLYPKTSYVQRNININVIIYITNHGFFSKLIRLDELENADFWTPSKRYSFLVENLWQIHHILVKSGPTRFWHILFVVSWRDYYEKHEVFQTFSLNNDSKHDKTLRKLQGFSLFLKMRHFHKLKNINIMQEIQYFLESTIATMTNILRKRSGFSLFLKMRHFHKLKYINIMQEIQYFLESSIRAGSPK